MCCKSDMKCECTQWNVHINFNDNTKIFNMKFPSRNYLVWLWNSRFSQSQKFL